jgi:16S rRNA (cytosine1402-N4)-methyltransferase
MKNIHRPVLLQETLHYLDVKPNANFIDATIDGGGLAEMVLECSEPKGRLLGIDWDAEMCRIAERRLEPYKSRASIVQANYVSLSDLCKKYSFGKSDGIVFDFGVSSFHFEEAGRGFSFQKDEPLDMRYNRNESRITAADILQSYSEERLASLFKTYGGERYAKRIAREIVKHREHCPIERTLQLAEIVSRSVLHRGRNIKRHPATKVFQALRIEVNQELENISSVLPQIFSTVRKGGRAVFISFHSLEDGIVKRFLKEQEKRRTLSIITKNPIVPTRSEIILNPRARSAKLRAALII